MLLSVVQEIQVNFYGFQIILGFPDSSVDKESTCNAGDPGSIPGSGRSPGEGKGCPLQYSGLENAIDRIIHGGRKESDMTERLSLPHSLTHSHGGDRESELCRSVCSMKAESAYILFRVMCGACWTFS